MSTAAQSDRTGRTDQKGTTMTATALTVSEATYLAQRVETAIAKVDRLCQAAPVDVDQLRKALARLRTVVRDAEAALALPVADEDRIQQLASTRVGFGQGRWVMTDGFDHQWHIIKGAKGYAVHYDRTVPPVVTTATLWGATEAVALMGVTA